MSDATGGTQSPPKKSGPNFNFNFQFNNPDAWVYIVSIVFSVITIWGFGHAVRTAIKSIFYTINPDNLPENVMVGREILGSQTTTGIFLCFAGLVGIISASSFVFKNSFIRFLLSLTNFGMIILMMWYDLVAERGLASSQYFAFSFHGIIMCYILFICVAGYQLLYTAQLHRQCSTEFPFIWYSSLALVAVGLVYVHFGLIYLLFFIIDFIKSVSGAVFLFPAGDYLVQEGINGLLYLIVGIIAFIPAGCLLVPNLVVNLIASAVFVVISCVSFLYELVLIYTTYGSQRNLLSRRIQLPYEFLLLHTAIISLGVIHALSVKLNDDQIGVSAIKAKFTQDRS